MTNIKTKMSKNSSSIVVIIAILFFISASISLGQTLDIGTQSQTASSSATNPEESLQSDNSVNCPEMTAPECTPEWRIAACQAVINKLEKVNPGCFKDWVYNGPLREFEVKGKIVDAKTGKGLKGISVQAWSETVENESAEATTGTDGTFSFTAFKGDWKVAPATDGSGYIYREVSVSVPQKSDAALVIQLQTSFAVTGKIIHRGNFTTLANYSLSFRDTKGEVNWFELEKSKAGGEFKIEGLSEGKYIAELWHEDPMLTLPESVSVEISEKTAPQNVLALAPLEVKKSSNKIQGRIFNARDQKGLVNVAVFAQGETGRQITLDTKTDKDGNYELTVPTGSWLVWPDFGERKDVALQDDPKHVTVGEGTASTGVDFRVLVTDATVRGIITLDGIKPIEDLSAYIEFQPEKADLPTVGDNVEHGQFSMALVPGTYNVWLHLPSGSRYAMTTVQPFQTVTANSNKTETIVVTVKERDVTIEGAVKDSQGKIITGLPVTVYAEAGGITEQTEVDTATGRYELKVYSAVYRTWTISYAIGETKQKFLWSNVTNYAMPVAANARVTQDLTVYLADASVSGKVVSDVAKPLAGSYVSYSNLDSEGNLFDTGVSVFEGNVVTEDNGSYQLFLPSGTYRLSVSQEGLISPDSQIVKISPQSPGRVDFKFLSADATVSGQVRISGKGTGASVWGWSDGGASVFLNTNAEGKFLVRVSRDVWHFGAYVTLQNKYYVSDEMVVDTAKESSKTVAIDLRLESEFILPPSITKTFDASSLTVVTMGDGTKLTVPAGAIQGSGMLTLIASPNTLLPVQENSKPIGLGYDLQVKNEKGRNIVKFPADVFVAIPYTSEQLQLYGLTENDLVPSYWNEKAHMWVPVKNVSVDRDHHYIVIATNHFTKFVLTTHKKIATVSKIPPVAIRQVPPEKIKTAIVENKAEAGQSLASILVILGVTAVAILIVVLYLLRRAKRR